MSAHELVLVLDYGSQYNLLITRRLREAGVYSELVDPATPWPELAAREPCAVVLSGGPDSVYDEGAPGLPPGLLESGLPILGICYGMQLLSKELGGRVLPGTVREYGPARFKVEHEDHLLAGLGPEEPCWMSHGDRVEEAPPGFRVMARTQDSVAVIGDRSRRIFGLQFHPEVHHTPRGKEILRSFLELAGCRFDWTPGSFVEETVASIRRQVGDGKAVCALSGGVDSTVAAALVGRALGERLECLFVDNAVLRAGEAEQVMESMDGLGLNVRLVDAADRFLEALAGVTDPETKRRRIGETFIRVFEGEIGSDVAWLVQGTLYPDVVESGARGGTRAATIKTHHNVGGLPEDMTLKLLEPLRLLFKDEVRRVGRELGLPESILQRQPFPGPGLAIRMAGEVNAERLGWLRHADRIVREEMEASGDVEGLWQYFAMLLPVRSVGVMGDKRTYGETVTVRAVRSVDAMTAAIARPSWEVLERIASRVVNEVAGVNRVLYDLTSKPPGTIEWE